MKKDLMMCPYFCKNLSIVMYRKFRNVPIFKDFPPICPYFLSLRVGKYDGDDGVVDDGDGDSGDDDDDDDDDGGFEQFEQTCLNRPMASLTLCD